jgi:hypothetical protein
MNTLLAVPCAHQSVTVKDLITLKKAVDNGNNPSAEIDDNSGSYQTQFLGMPHCTMNRVVG